MARRSNFTKDENDRLREALRTASAGFRTLGELAKRLGISGASLSNFLRGETGASPALAESIALLLGATSLDQIIRIHISVGRDEEMEHIIYTFVRDMDKPPGTYTREFVDLMMNRAKAAPSPAVRDAVIRRAERALAEYYLIRGDAPRALIHRVMRMMEAQDPSVTRVEWKDGPGVKPAHDPSAGRGFFRVPEEPGSLQEYTAPHETTNPREKMLMARYLALKEELEELGRELGAAQGK